MASLAHLAICCGYACLKDDVALVFDGNATAKAALFIDLKEVLPKSLLLNAHQCDRSEPIRFNISDRRLLLSVG